MAAVTEWLIQEFAQEEVDRNAVSAEEVRANGGTTWNSGTESGEPMQLRVFTAKALWVDYHSAAPVMNRPLGHYALIEEAKLARLAGWLEAYSASGGHRYPVRSGKCHAGLCCSGFSISARCELVRQPVKHWMHP